MRKQRLANGVQRGEANDKAKTGKRGPEGGGARPVDSFSGGKSAGKKNLVGRRLLVD